ncbi:DNA-formamidopyrimidine glycosylase family protein [Vallicoccus soli]|uniref:DNA-(apurinic or apyrimidinic site) lyase n=1 Tax=Vallicoccus soli TaxID=2339232 RepID=A0A3A3YXS3_9ACTN|nr:DNA-formamidopyrimidine glycosylase family protein [Vallicoccus soli]RJK96479.1 Fpg/Nei family DNA glycosylase [Vallicoccus soli]
MPEGDTVWLAGRRLHRALAGEVLVRTDFRVPQLAGADLAGRRVLEVVSRGKHLLTRVEGGWTLHTHFRMDGTWHLYRHGERWRGGPQWQVRVLLVTREWQAVGYRLPVVELLPTAQEDRAVGHLGPDLLGSDWDQDEALRRLRADPDREVAQALLDQRNLAGIGNLYKAESLYLAGESPWTPVREVGDLPALVDRAHRLLVVNREHSAQVTTGDKRRGREHWVFGREGQPCRRCGTAVRMAEQGPAPYARVTWWCPVCQPGPAPEPVPPAQRRPPPVGQRTYRP